MSAVIDEGLNGGSIGLTVKISFNASKAIEDLKATLTSIKDFKINLDLSSITAATEEIKKLNEMKLNIEGQEASLKYFTSVTQQLEKQVEMSERMRQNMEAAGAKGLLKQHAADQKELYNASLKAMEDIVKYEAQRASLTGKEKTKMTAMIKSRREDLETLSKMITMEQYSVLFADKRKKMENDVTAERLKQQQAVKTNNEQKNVDRLKEAEKTYKRIVELRLKIYELGKNSAEAEPFKKELKGLNDIIRGYKSAKATKKELKKMTDEMDTAYQQGVVEIDQKRQKELEAQASKQQASEDKLRLEEVTRLLKRRQELELQLYKGNLTKNQTVKYTKEIESLNQTIAKLKEYESTKDKIKIMESSTNDDTSKKKATIDETVQKQEYDKTAKHLDSIGKQIKDLNKQFYAADGYAAKANVAERLIQLEQELDKYREIVTFKEKIAQLDNEIATSKAVDMSKAMDKQESKSTQSQDQINKAWSGEYYTQLKQSMNEALSIEKQLRQELFKTHGIKADNIQLDQQYVASLKEQGGLIGQLASNLQTAQKNMVKYKELTDSSEYNNVVKDHSVQEKQAKISRDSAVNQEKVLQAQIEEAKTIQELIPAEQRLLQLQLERLKNNKYLTDEQRTQLNAVEEQILALNGNSKKEVSQNARSIRDNMRYEQSVAALNKENLALEDQKRLEQELVQSIQQKTRHAIEDLETGKLAKNVDKERLETIRQMAESAKGLNLAELKTLSQNINSQLKDVKHQATISSRSDAESKGAKELERFIQSQKESLTKQTESLKKEELKGYVLEANTKQIQAQINALSGANKEEVKANSEAIKKSIVLEQITAQHQKELDLTTAQAQAEIAAFYTEQEQANVKAQNQAQLMKNKIGELTVGKQLTEEQSRQIKKLKEYQRLMESGVISNAHYNQIKDSFNVDYQTYKSEGRQASQTQAQQEELALAQKLVETNKQKLQNRIEYIEVSKNGAYVDKEELQRAKQMVSTLNGLSRTEVAQNTREIDNLLNNISSQARNRMLRETGTLMQSLGQSLRMFTHYFSSYTLVTRFFHEFREGLNVLREVDETMTTLRITLTNFSEKELETLMKSTKELAIELKTSFEDVMNVVKTVANETESMTTIMAKARPALILSNLTGLGTDQTVEMIQGVTRQYSSQFEEMGLTAEEQGMKVADTMVSISRALGMDFATGIKGMAEGIEIMGALSNELGMSVEETMALMAATSEQTRLTFSEIANAFKTTMARTIRISGTDEEITPEELAKTEKALNGVNVQVRNMETGELRSFIDIMNDLAEIWDTLNDSQRGAIGDAMGGARQISTIMASINVTDRRKELTAIAEESAGAAEVAQETWSKGLEAKLKALEDAKAVFWQSFISSESYHQFLEMLTSLVNGATKLVEKFGSIEVAGTAVSAMLLIFNKNLRNNVLNSLNDLVPGLGRVSAKMINFSKDARASITMYKGLNTEIVATIASKRAMGLATTKETGQLVANTLQIGLNTAALVANKVAVIALKGALSMGLSMAIGAVVSHLTKMVGKLIDSRKAAKELAEQTKESYDEIKSGLESHAEGKGLIERYEKLVEAIENYKKALKNSELVAEEVEITSNKLKEAQSELVSIQEQLIELYPEASSKIDEQGKLIFGQIQDYKDLTEAEREYYNEKMRLLAMEATVNRSNVEAQIEDNNKKKEKLQWEYEQHINSQNQYEYGSQYHKQFGEMATQKAKKMQELAKENFELEQQLAQYDTVLTWANNTQNELIQSTNNLTEEEKKLADATDEVSKAQEDAIKSAEELAIKNKEAAGSYVDSIKDIQTIEELLEKINNGEFYLSDAETALGLMDGFDGDISNINDVYDNLQNRLSELVTTQGELYAEMMEQDKEFWNSKYKNSDDWVKYVQSSEKDILSIVSESLGEQAGGFMSFINKMGGFRDVDLSNTKNLAEAKGKVESHLVSELKRLWQEYYKAQSAIIHENVRQDIIKNNPNASIGKAAAMVEEALKELNAQDAVIQELLNNINTTIKPVYNGGSNQSYLGKKPSSSSSSSSSSSEVDDLDLDINRYHDLERAITRVNNALEANKIAQENAKPTKKIQLMKEEIKLYGQLRDAQKALYAEQKKEASELKKKLSKNGFTFNADGTLKNYQSRLEALEKQANKLSGDAKKKKIEEVKGLKEIADAYEQLINETMPNTQKEYQELSNTIKQAQREQLEYVADLQSQLTDAITEELQKRHDAVRKALEKERDLYDKQYEEDQWEDSYNEEQRKLAEIQAQIDALSRDFSEAGRLKLEQLMEEYKEQQKVIDDMLNDKNHQDGLDRFDEALEELDQKLEDALTPESLAQMVAQALEKGFISLNGEVIKTENLLTQMLENSGDLFKATGQLLKTELIDGLKVAQGLLKDVNSLTASITGNNSRAVSLPQTSGLAPLSRAVAVDTSTMVASVPNVTVSFGQLLNVEGNLDTSLMLELDTKLRQAMNEVTHSISQALSYR